MKSLALGAFFAALTTIITMSGANAYCSLKLLPIHVESGGVSVVISGRVNSRDTFSYFGVTTNIFLGNLLLIATAQRIPIHVRGDLPNCIFKGEKRYIGKIIAADF